jgi:hypothetical protein
MLRRVALPVLLALVVVAVPCVAQEKGATKATGKDTPGGLPRKDSSQKAPPAAGKPAAGATMDTKPAPKAGSMPGGQTPPPKGRLGTEPTRQDKLGTPPPKDSKDRPPRPQ